MWDEVCGPEGERAWGSGGRKRGAHADDPRLGGSGGRVRAAERTENMSSMALDPVTLDVSKLSGWLKAAAFCRGRKQGVGCGARCAGRKAWGLGRGAAAGARGVHAEDPGLEGCGGRARAAERT